MKRLKNERGITLIILVITVIVLLILTSVNINTTKNQVGLKEVNNLYTDIDIISSKVTEYYLKENELPVLDSDIKKIDLMNYLKDRGIFSFALNGNDGDKYYVIDLSKLDNLSLNYGKDYSKWTSNKLEENINDDIYIINETTHQIYYPRGIQNATEYIITNTINKKTIDKEQIEQSIKNDETNIIQEYQSVNTGQIVSTYDFSREEVNKRTISEDGNGLNVIVIDTKVKVEISEQFYKKESLQFQYSTEANSTEDKYVNFSLDNNNKAILTSNSLKIDAENYPIYLWIRALDINGNWVERWQQIPY